MLKTFISYKWQDEAHNRWVETFAGDLRAAGIDAQLDKWEIRFGDSIQNYMTSRIDEADVVLCVITDEYVRRVDAPDGEGGYVQFEIELANAKKLARDKDVRVIGVYRQGSQTPTYLRSHLYVDFRDDAQYADRFRELVDDLRGISKRPPLGVPQLKDFEVWENSIGLKMVQLPAGTFEMGSADVRHATSHAVRITEPFLMGVYPATQAEYGRICWDAPSHFKSDDRRPVERVSWFNAVEFCNRLSEAEGKPPYYDVQGQEVTVRGGVGYRLPTEAEWEYACRAGRQTAYCFGDDAKLLGQYAWFYKNSDRKTHPVGQKKPNAWGLYDMHGNVWEWCWDWYGEYPTGPQENPTDPSESTYRVIRGGSWFSDAGGCRSAFRDWSGPEDPDDSLGFRVAAVPSSQLQRSRL